MEKLTIICIDDQSEVLDAFASDLSDYFEPAINIVECDSTFDGEDAIEELEVNGDYLAVLVCDHVMPERTGIEFLSSFTGDDMGSKAKKVLLTGQATHKDTIEAINNNAIDQYIEKPWIKEKLIGAVKKMITEFIIAEGIDYQQYVSDNILDSETLMNAAKKWT